MINNGRGSNAHGHEGARRTGGPLHSLQWDDLPPANPNGMRPNCPVHEDTP